MDIFEKMDNESTEQNQRTPLGALVPKIEISEDGRISRCVNVKYQDENYNPYNFAFREPKNKPCERTGLMVKARTYRLYDYLIRYHALREESMYCLPSEKNKKKQKKILKKINKLLKKGVNFKRYFTENDNSEMLYKMDEEVLALLYDYGFNIKEAVLSKSTLCFKNIYFAITNDDLEKKSYRLLTRIPLSMLEKILTTRKDVCVSYEVVSSLISDMTRLYSYENHANLIEMLFTYGAISLYPQQIYNFCNSGLATKKDCPNVWMAYDMLFGGSSSGDSDKKYSTQKTITGTASDKKSEAQSAIDKLFDDAQKAVE